jgi:predicted phage terminase large subunit-like protein
LDRPPNFIGKLEPNGLPPKYTKDGWVWWRQHGRKNLLFLCRWILGYSDVCSEVHWPLIEQCQKFKGGVDDFEFIQRPDGIGFKTTKEHPGYRPACSLWELKGPRKALTLYPRGHLKSTICTIGHKIQWVLNYPDVRILLSAATDDQVKKFLVEIKGHFQFNETFRYLYPEYCPQGKGIKEFGNQEQFTVPNRKLKRKEPTFSTATIGSVVSSGHYEVVNNDDIVDKENVRTADQMANVISHIGMLGPLVETSEIEPYVGWMDFTGTRYHFGDAYGMILESERKRKAEGQPPLYKVLEQSAIRKGNLFDEDAEVIWPARVPLSRLREIYNDPMQGPGVLACTPAGSPVIMADWSEKPIEQIAPGDEVVGFVRDGNGKFFRQKAVRSRVKAVHRTRGIVQKMTMTTGDVAYCTPDHRWFTGRYATSKEPQRKSYVPARVGTEMVLVSRPLRKLTLEQQRWMDWLGGILDGEGSCHGNNSIFISQSESANPEVSRAIPQCLKLLGYEWTQFNRPAGQCGNRNHRAATQWMLRGGRDMARDILNHALMAKRQRIIDSLYRRSRGLSLRNGGKHIVSSIEVIGEQEVYALETETGNYIVWGYASSNSQYLQNPKPDGTGLVESESQIVFIPRKVMDELRPRWRVGCTIDLAGMEPNRAGGDNDFSVLTPYGHGADGSLYIDRIFRGRFTPFQVIDYMFRIYRDYPKLRWFKIEKDANARVLLPFLKREMSIRGIHLPILEIQRDNQTSKQQRIKGLQPWFHAGKIRFADDIPCKIDLINEILGFPKFPHDDILDTLADAQQDGEGGADSGVYSRPFSQQDAMTEHIFARRYPEDAIVNVPGSKFSNPDLFSDWTDASSKNHKDEQLSRTGM